MSNPLTQVRVESGDRGYAIHIGHGALTALAAVFRDSHRPAPRRVALIADSGVPSGVTSGVEAGLRNVGIDPVVLPLTPSEIDKSLTTVQNLLVELSRHRLERGDAVVALGGGIVGDIAGFVAATYRRGIPLIQCPTTLLAMVDASVGGKTGVNLSIGDLPGDLKKNMVGAFHQPAAVIADVAVLSSLPDRHFRSGLAECVKHGMLAADWGDPGLLDWLAAHVSAFSVKEPGVLSELVQRNVRVKAAVVRHDERELDESGGRMSLNLGHTFAHALETLPSVGPAAAGDLNGLQHGEAVAIGLVAASRTASAMGLLPQEQADSVVSLLRSMGLPTAARNLPADELILILMSHDKKVNCGRLRVVLPTGPGRVAIISDPPLAAISAGLQAIRA